jgi:hypothetical protein
MKRTLLLLLLAACGSGVEKPDEVVPPTHGRAGESCVVSSCEAGLVCKTGRGSTLCYPQTWFTGKKSSFCFTDGDCNVGLSCDLNAANPFTNGVCAGNPASN